MNRNDLLAVVAACTAISVIAVSIAAAHVISWRMLIDAGYEEAVVVGRSAPVWRPAKAELAPNPGRE